MDNLLTVTRHQKAFANVHRDKCEQCGGVPDVLRQYWHLFPGERPLSKRAERLLPAFCDEKCWHKFVDGKQYSDQDELSRKRVKYAAAVTAVAGTGKE